MLRGAKVETAVWRTNTVSDSTLARERQEALILQDNFTCQGSTLEHRQGHKASALGGCEEVDELSTCSDLELGVADQSSNSLSGVNDKNPGMQDAVYVTA